MQNEKAVEQLPTLPVRGIQDNIFGQLETSRDIFKVVSDLADVARKYQNEGLDKDIEPIMEELLTIGDRLSGQASTAGKQISDFIKANQ